MAHPTWVEGRANTGLNVNDFKLQLYSQLKSSGVLSTLKTQLRSQVLNKLQTEHGAAIAPAQQAQQNLWRRAMNSIVAEYLAASRYDYTLSVFQPECGLSSAAPFTHAEILQVLHIEEATPLHLALAKRGVHAKDPAGSPPQQCFALSLLEAVAELSSRRTAHESATQTSEGPGAARLGLQLTQLEDAYLTRADSERQKPFDTLEARMARYRQECDQRVKEEVAMQVERVRELELSAVRLEEADRHRKALEGEREALDRLHQAKLGKLREREELTTERLQRQQRDVENVAFEHRQRILREEDRLRAAKAEWEADMGALQERLRHREQHAESREKAVLLRENEAERRTAEALEAAASAHVTARKEVEKEYSVQRESIRRERVALETDRVRVLELKNDTAAELAEARLTRERLRAAEAARAEAESRAGVHAAAEECLMLQVQELRRALAEANEQLRHGGKLPSSVLRQLAGIENRGDRIRAVHDDSHQQPYGWQAEALRLEAVVRQLKRQAGQLAHDLAASQARENFWRGTAQAADRIVDEAVAGREGSLQAVEEARLALMASERDLQELRDQLDQAQQQRAGSQAGGVTSTAQASPARGMGFPFPMHGSLAHTEQGALVQSFGARSAGSHRLDEVLRAEERLKSEVVAFKRRVEAQRDASAHHMRRVMAGIVQLQDESATSDMTSFSSDNGTSFISDSRHATPARASLHGRDSESLLPRMPTFQQQMGQEQTMTGVAGHVASDDADRLLRRSQPHSEQLTDAEAEAADVLADHGCDSYGSHPAQHESEDARDMHAPQHDVCSPKTAAAAQLQVSAGDDEGVWPRRLPIHRKSYSEAAVPLSAWQYSRQPAADAHSAADTMLEAAAMHGATIHPAAVQELPEQRLFPSLPGMASPAANGDDAAAAAALDSPRSRASHHSQQHQPLLSASDLALGQSSPRSGSDQGSAGTAYPLTAAQPSQVTQADHDSEDEWGSHPARLHTEASLDPPVSLPQPGGKSRPLPPLATAAKDAILPLLGSSSLAKSGGILKKAPVDTATMPLVVSPQQLQSPAAVLAAVMALQAPPRSQAAGPLSLLQLDNSLKQKPEAVQLPIGAEASPSPTAAAKPQPSLPGQGQQPALALEQHVPQSVHGHLLQTAGSSQLSPEAAASAVAPLLLPPQFPLPEATNSADLWAVASADGSSAAGDQAVDAEAESTGSDLDSPSTMPMMTWTIRGAEPAAPPAAAAQSGPLTAHAVEQASTPAPTMHASSQAGSAADVSASGGTEVGAVHIASGQATLPPIGGTTAPAAIAELAAAVTAHSPPSLSGADAAMREPGYETDVESVASVIKSLASEELNMPASSRAQDGVLEVLGVAPSQEASTHATPRTDPHPLDNSDAYLSDPESSLPAKLPSAEDGSIGSLSADDFFGRNGTGSDSEDSVF